MLTTRRYSFRLTQRLSENLDALTVSRAQISNLSFGALCATRCKFLGTAKILGTQLKFLGATFIVCNETLRQMTTD